MSYMTNIIATDERYKANAHPTTENYDDKEGVTFTEHLVQVAEKNSRTYAVRGCKSMAEALRYVNEEGTYGDEEIIIVEKDGWWEHHHGYNAKPVETNKYSACAFKGRCFDGPTPEKDFMGTPYIYCTSYLDGHEGGVCIQCSEALERGWTLRPKKEE